MRENQTLAIVAIILAFLSIVIQILSIPAEGMDIPEPKEPDVIETIDAEPAEIVWTEVEATAYCPCEKCCGKYADGITYSGDPATEGATVAADLDKYPLGTFLEIEGVGVRLVQDKGSAIKGDRIDVYFDSHDDALKFGRRKVKMRVLENPQ